MNEIKKPTGFHGRRKGQPLLPTTPAKFPVILIVLALIVRVAYLAKPILGGVLGMIGMMVVMALLYVYYRRFLPHAVKDTRGCLRWSRAFLASAFPLLVLAYITAIAFNGSEVDDFDSSASQSSRRNLPWEQSIVSGMEKLSWPVSSMVLLPEAPYRDDKKEKILFLVWTPAKSHIITDMTGKQIALPDRDTWSIPIYHYELPPSRRASSIETADIVFRLQYSDTNAPNLEWVTTRNHREISRGPVGVPMWLLSRWQRRSGTVETYKFLPDHVYFTGHAPEPEKKMKAWLGLGMNVHNILGFFSPETTLWNWLTGWI